MTMFTKKHFEAIAKILNKHYDNSPAVEMLLVDNSVNERIVEIAQDLSEYFKTINPAFDEAKFEKAVFNYNCK